MTFSKRLRHFCERFRQRTGSMTRTHVLAWRSSEASMWWAATLRCWTTMIRSYALVWNLMCCRKNCKQYMERANLILAVFWKLVLFYLKVKATKVWFFGFVKCCTCSECMLELVINKQNFHSCNTWMWLFSFIMWLGQWDLQAYDGV